jgi:hypothetical protein
MIEVSIILSLTVAILFAILYVGQKNRVDELEDMMRTESESTRNNQQNIWAEIYDTKQKVDPDVYTISETFEGFESERNISDPDDYRELLTSHQRVNLKGLRAWMSLITYF